jgi:hypothetical protein
MKKYFEQNGHILLQGLDLNVRELGESLREKSPRGLFVPIIERTQSYKIVLQRGETQFWCPGAESNFLLSD